MGGSVLYIETQGIKRSKLDADGKPGVALKVTRRGDVMKVRTLLSFQFVEVYLTFITSHLSLQESTQIAYTVARARLAGIDDKLFFDNTDIIHMHVPEGATRWSLRRRRHGDINVIARVGSADSKNDL
jgi:Lon-like ATP-dependent protease